MFFVFIYSFTHLLNCRNAAQKRKLEVVREEKRRQEILNKRHQEQKQATEKYQRCHVGTRPRFSPRHHAHSPTQGHMDLEEALQLVRGGSGTRTGTGTGSPNEQSRGAMQRMYHQQHHARDSLDRSYLRASRVGSAGPGEERQGRGRPMSGGGRPQDASTRAELMERSMRNMTSSRSRFEQQLEHHQQFLMEQQQKSLHDFNQAIRREIDSDTKVQGVEDNEADNLPWRSESLSSLDSLEQEEEDQSSSLGNSQQDHQALKEFHQMAEQQRDVRQIRDDFDHGDFSAKEQQQARKFGAEPNRPSLERAGRPQSVKVPAARDQHSGGDCQRHPNGQSQGDRAAITSMAGNGHVIGPIPQGYYSPPAGTPPSCTPVIQGNLSYYPDSLDANHSSSEKRVTVGTALRLPQQPSAASQAIKQPPPTLQYDSQLLMHRKFENRPNHSGVVGKESKHANDSSGNAESAQQRNRVANSRPVPEQQPTSALTQDEHPRERPKAHVYAWTSPPPVENDQDLNSAPPAASQHTVDRQASSDSSHYTANMVADRVMATNLHPQTSRNISTAATTTWVYQTVNSTRSKEPAFSQANTNSVSVSPSKTSSGSQPTHAEIPKGQGQKPGTALTSTGTYPSATGLKFVASVPASFQGHPHLSDHNRQQGSDNQNLGQGHTGSVREPSGSTHQQQRGGSINQGTLGLVNGRLTVIDSGQPQNACYERKITVVEDQTDNAKEVRGILKRMNKDEPSKATGGGQTRFNVQDSVEIAKKHLQHNTDLKRKTVG